MLPLPCNEHSVPFVIDLLKGAVSILLIEQSHYIDGCFSIIHCVFKNSIHRNRGAGI